MSAFDANQPSASTVSDAEKAMATDSLPASDVAITPVKSASCLPVSRVQQPNVFSGYPVLTLPLCAGSPHRRPSPARSSHTPSPRKLPSSASPSHRQVSASKTPLKGQPCIDQVFQPISSQAASVPEAESVQHSSLLPLPGQTLSSEIQSCCRSSHGKWTRPDGIFVSPLLSRNREHFVTVSAPKDVQSADVSSVGINRLELNCNSSVMQKDNCSLDTVTPTDANPVGQSVSVDDVMETSSVKNAQVTSAEAEVRNSAVASVVSSTECSNDVVSQKPADKKAAINVTMLRIPAVKLQKLQAALGKSMLACAKSVKMTSSNDATSEASVWSSPSVASALRTGVNDVTTNCEAASTSACTTSDAVSDEASSNMTVTSSRKSTSAVSSKVGDIGHNVQCDIYQTAVKMDVSDTDPSASDGKVNAVTTSKHPDISRADRQIVPYSGVVTSSLSAADEVEPKNLAVQLDSGDSQMDLDKHIAEDSVEFLYAPIDSMLSF